MTASAVICAFVAVVFMLTRDRPASTDGTDGAKASGNKVSDNNAGATGEDKPYIECITTRVSRTARTVARRSGEALLRADGWTPVGGGAQGRYGATLILCRGTDKAPRNNVSQPSEEAAPES